MAETQTKFVLSDDARWYLRWLAKDVLFLKSEHDPAKYLVTRQMEQLRRENRGTEPLVADLRAQFSSQPSELLKTSRRSP